MIIQVLVFLMLGLGMCVLFSALAGILGFGIACLVKVPVAKAIGWGDLRGFQLHVAVHRRAGGQHAAGEVTGQRVKAQRVRRHGPRPLCVWGRVGAAGVPVGCGCSPSGWNGTARVGPCCVGVWGSRVPS